MELSDVPCGVVVISDSDSGSDRGQQRIVATDNKSESCLVAYKLCHFQFIFGLQKSKP